jgi:coproporphyrinogen III oxidase
MTDPHFEPAARFFEQLQVDIVTQLEVLDGGRFRHDDWQRDEPHLRGFGRTRVLEDGAVLEKAGVNYTCIDGEFSEAFAATMPGEGRDFRATGLSIVLHPRNPYVPTVHMNYRRLSRGSTGWFGGGADLTPYYVDEGQAAHFHRVHRLVCERHGIDWRRLVDQCDQYFYLPHRQERRGVGGLFFDHEGSETERWWAFVQDAGRAFLPSWLPIAEQAKDRPYGEREREWQEVRRGRYVEFNLVLDRGTIFGFKTGGRIESILMSLPLHASWRYRHEPEQGSPEAALLEWVRTGYRPV